MFSHNYLFNWGQALYGSGTNAKRTASINNDSMTSVGSGQNIMNNAVLNCWGMSDCARDSTTITYAGGNVAGDEARGFTVVSRLQQLGNLVKTTLSSGPTRSGCPANMTLTQSVTANVTPQAVTVSSNAGCQIGDWLVADWNGATGYPNWDAIQITSVGSGTITGRFTANHASGATVKAGVVLTVSSTFELGQDRVLVDLSGSSYATGTATASNTAITGSGTAWSNSMVGGETISPGCFAFTGDDQTYSPFGTGANALRSWWEINASSVTGATTLSIFSFSVPGAGFYNGVGSGAYVIRPCARIVFMSGNTVVLSPNSFTWTNGDAIEQALTPYPDVQGFNYFVSGYTPGGIYRGFMNIANNGGQQHGNVFTVQNIMVGNTSSSSPSAFHAFLADAGGNGSNPMLDYILDFGNTTLKSGSMRLPSPFNPATNGDITWNQTAATVGTARDGSSATGLELCGLGGGGGARPDGCFYGDLRNTHPMARMQSHGLEIDGGSDDVLFAMNKTNDDLFIHTTTGGHILSGGQYINHGFLAEIGINGTELPYYVLGTNTSGTPGFFALPEAAAISGTNHRSIRLGVGASVWNGSAESPVWAFWDLEPDSNATNATTHAYLYGPCASPITNNCQYLAAGLDGLTVTGPAAADYWASTLGTAIAAAATIAPAKYITHVTGTTAITTITPPAACSASGKSCLLVLVPDAANVYNTGGNIANALTATVNVPVLAVYDNSAGKWYLK